jgi:hypothetical protein
MFRKQFCPICKKHGRSEAEYTSHNPREGNDETSRPLCPILLDLRCNRCGGVGHIAAKCPDKSCVFCNQPGHTVYYCRNGSREEIDEFLKQRNLDYEERKWRNNNNNSRFEMRQERPNMFGSQRPSFTNDERVRRPYSDNRNMFDEQRRPYSDNRNMFDEQRRSYSDNRPTYIPNNTVFNNFTKFMEEEETAQEPIDDFPKKEEIPSLGKKEEFPSLGKKEEFPSLGKEKPASVPKMNFAGIASIMTEPAPKPAPKPVSCKKTEIHKSVSYDECADEDMDPDEYRDRLFDSLVDEYHNGSRSASETWDMAYKRITRTVDREVEAYEQKIAYKNANNNDSYHYNDNDDDDNW